MDSSTTNAVLSILRHILERDSLNIASQSGLDAELLTVLDRESNSKTRDTIKRCIELYIKDVCRRQPREAMVSLSEVALLTTSEYLACIATVSLHAFPHNISELPSRHSSAIFVTTFARRRVIAASSPVMQLVSALETNRNNAKSPSNDACSGSLARMADKSCAWYCSSTNKTRSSPSATESGSLSCDQRSIKFENMSKPGA